MDNDSFFSGIKASAKVNFPDLEIVNIKDRGQWIRRIYEVHFNNGLEVFFKLLTHNESSDNLHEKNVVIIFKENNIPAPNVLVVDNSCLYLPYPYIIQEKIGGIRLGDLIENLPESDILEIYEEIGKIYKRIHNVTNDVSGLWSENPYEVLYPVSPNDYMYNAEIVNGSGKLAVIKGVITEELYNKIVNVWNENLDYLKNHTPTMIHNSPFIWNIYLDKNNDGYRVTKLMSLGDVLWWDSAYDLAAIKYPPFSVYKEERWKAFLKGYGKRKDEKRILLYALMHRLCASMGVYMEPSKYHSEEWINTCSRDLEEYLDKLNQL